MKTAFDSYYFHADTFAKPFAPCVFPIWMQGEFDTMKVTSHELQYLQSHVGAVPLISHCVQTFEDRVMVYSETKCGEPLGYHCLLFNARSQNLIEFKTTLPSESSNTSVCLNETQWENMPWSSSVVLNTTPYPCGLFGSFSTPKQLETAFCYDLVFDCDDSTKMNISAYHCEDGIIFDSRSYTCLASWRDNERLMIYSSRGSNDNECFVSHYQDNRLYFATTGDQCDRNFDFEKNDKQTMVLQEKQSCRRPVIKSRKQSTKPIQSKAMASRNYNLTTTTQLPTNIEETETPIETTDISVLSDEFWFSNGNNNYSLCKFSIYFAVFYLLH